MSTLFSMPRPREFTAAGTVMPGAKLYFYVSGTSTAATTYQNAALSTAHANPVVADVGGLFPAIWLNNNVAYDVTLKDSAGSTQWSVSAVTGAAQTTVVLTSAQTGEPYTSTSVRYVEPSGTIKGFVGFSNASDNRFTITSREDANIQLLTGTPGDATSSMLRAAVYGDSDQSWISIYSGTTTGGAELRFYDSDATTVIGKVGHTSVADDDLDIQALVAGADLNLSATVTGEVILSAGGTNTVALSSTALTLTGVGVVLSAGAEATPSISFVADADTGVYRAGNNILGFSANSVNSVSVGQAGLLLKDGVTAPSAVAGFAYIYVDTADGDLKVVFGDGTVKTIVVDT